ncbi:MAG: hypothetical protein ACOCY1_04935, partial [Halovenus sp.]
MPSRLPDNHEPDAKTAVADGGTWLCDGCDEPKPTDECWPCNTADGRLVLCPACRDERGVEPITLPDGGQHWDSRIHAAGDLYWDASMRWGQQAQMAKGAEEFA